MASEEARRKANARWREKNKEKLKKYISEWRRANKSKLNAYFRNYYKENTEKVQAMQKAWRQRNPDKMADKIRRDYENRDKVKWAARQCLRYGVQCGAVLKPKKCQSCNKVKPLQWHHTDYSKPLDVEWFCVKCHRVADDKLERHKGSGVSRRNK